jgi:hypothetical protein
MGYMAVLTLLPCCYLTAWLLLQWWCLYEPEVSARKLKRGKSGNGGCKRRTPPYRTELIGADAEQLAARFLEWYICDGLGGVQGEPRSSRRSALQGGSVHTLHCARSSRRSALQGALHTGLYKQLRAAC